MNRDSSTYKGVFHLLIPEHDLVIHKTLVVHYLSYSDIMAIHSATRFIIKKCADIDSDCDWFKVVTFAPDFIANDGRFRGENCKLIFEWMADKSEHSIKDLLEAEYWYKANQKDLYVG